MPGNSGQHPFDHSNRRFARKLVEARPARPYSTNMTQPEDFDPRSKLPWKSLLVLAFSMAAIGSGLIVGSLLAYHYFTLYRMGAFEAEVTAQHFYWSPLGELLVQFFLTSLIVNFIAALALIAILAVWRRLRRA
jgi:hypothetical protein